MELLLEAIKEGTVPAIIVAVYLIITKNIEAKKEKNFAQLNANLVDSINCISRFVQNVTKNIIDADKDKAKIAIEDAMYSAGMRLQSFVISTIINNNIHSNSDSIHNNVHNISNAEYYSVWNTLSMYNVNGIACSSFMKVEWIGEIEKDIIDTIYNKGLTDEEKINSFSNKISLKFQSYIAFINNSAFISNKKIND